MKRKFYILGPNPNTVESAFEFLKKGANALEPDICYHPESPEKFFVYDNEDPRDCPPFIDIKKRALKDYLTGLSRELVSNPSYNLALIAFDLKPPFYKRDATPSYDISELLDFITEYFSKQCPNVAIVTTVGKIDGMDFLSKSKLASNFAVGVDDGATPEQVNDFFNPLNVSYTYANGTSSPIGSSASKSHLQKICDAVMMRDNGKSFSLVYAWTVTSAHSMETYLDHDVDGILTNIHDVDKLLQLINNRYSQYFELATQDHNPFIPPVP